MKCSHVALAWISGSIWAAVGFFLLSLGLGLLASHQEISTASYPLMDLISPYLGGTEQATVVLIALGLYIGFLKGKHVLGKSARKGIQRIKSLPNPVSLTQIYGAKYYLLLGGMIGLGMSIKYLGIPSDLRGFIDVAIGSALIQGALVYFRMAGTLKPEAASEA